MRRARGELMATQSAARREPAGNTAVSGFRLWVIFRVRRKPLTTIGFCCMRIERPPFWGWLSSAAPREF